MYSFITKKKVLYIVWGEKRHLSSSTPSFIFKNLFVILNNNVRGMIIGDEF